MNNKESECPCKDCITFSICRSEMYSNISFQVSVHVTIYHLRDKCKIIEDYLIDKENKTLYNMTRHYEVLELFGIKEDTKSRGITI